MQITIDNFITHVAYTRNKQKVNKFKKINGQTIYNSAVSRFARAIVMDNLHSYLSEFIPNRKIKDSFSTVLEFHAPVNYGTVKRTREGEIMWKAPEKDYVPNWDIDNQWIWIKAFHDTLKLKGIIKEDTISYITGYELKFIPVEDINDRKLVFKINRHARKNNKSKSKTR